MAFVIMQNCINEKAQKAKAEQKKLKGKADLNAVQITNMEPICSNSLNIRESVKRLSYELDSLGGQVGSCMGTFNKSIEAAIENVRKPFSQLDQAAKESINLYDKVIENYDSAYNKLNNDLEGEGGYRAQLRDLEKLKLEMNDILNGPVKDINSGGLARRIDLLKIQRNDSAKKWLGTLMNETVSCFRNDPTLGCRSDGSNPTAPESCILDELTRIDGNQSSRNQPTANALSSAKRRAFLDVLTIQYGSMRKLFQTASIDAKDSTDFINKASARFATVSNQMTSILASKNFNNMISPAQQNALSQFYSEKMNQCFQMKMDDFKNEISTEGSGNYRNEIIKIEEAEKNILNDANKMIEVATSQMNSFRTNFTKVFNNDLAQFKSNCSAGKNAYDAVTCLTQIDKILDNGINGINSEGVTVMNIPVVKMTNGVAQQGTQSFQCIGFKDCLNVMGKARDFNKEQSDSQKQARTSFAQTHNKTVDTAFGAIAQQFVANSQILNQKVAEINNTLSSFGVSKTLDPKTIEGETLNIDDKTGLYTPPKSMKAALANKTGFMELTSENTKDVLESIAERKKEIVRKGARAAQMLAQCEVKASDYKAVMNMLPKCKDAKDARSVCRSRGSLIPAIESLVNKSLNKLREKEDRKDITERLDRCSKQDRTSFVQEKAEIETAFYGEKPSKEQLIEFRTKKIQEQKEDLDSCFTPALANLKTLNQNSRNSDLQGNNAKLITKAETLINACSKLDVNDTTTQEEVISACQDLQSSSDITLPSGEPEEGNSDSISNPARSGR